MSSSPPSASAACEPRARPALHGETALRPRHVLIIGAGLLGSGLADGAVRTGLSIGACDLDLGTPENLPRQRVEVGVPKAESVAASCNALRPGAARAHVCDVRQLGVGVVQSYRVLLDASDDPALKSPLSELSSGLGIPLVRAALDGSGERALGRVRVSHGGAGHACLCCHARGRDLARPGQRTPCPGAPVTARAQRPPTRAGVASAMAIGGLAIHVVQALLDGREDVLDREIYLDLAGACLVGSIARDEACLARHERWELEPLGRSAVETTLGELFLLAERELGHEQVRLEPFANPISPSVRCPGCGTWKIEPGSRWAPAPLCACGARTERQSELALSELTLPMARALALLDLTCLELGMPEHGALITARAPGSPIRRFLLE